MGPLRPVTVAAAVGCLLAGRYRKQLGLGPALSTGVVACAPPLAAAALPRGRARSAGVWAAQMWAYKIAFEVPHDHESRHRRRLRIDYPIEVDRRIGLGVPPGERLQGRLRRPPRVTALDVAITAIYAAWDAEPHVVLGYLLLRRPERFPRAAVRLGATFDLTLLGYWLVPTAPPWWASEKAGRMSGVVRRVAVEASREVKGEDRPAPEHELGHNPWAAMPSDHFATAAMTAMILSELGGPIAAVGWAYAAALGFALVYLGEHYVTDVLAGGALAAGVQLLATRLD